MISSRRLWLEPVSPVQGLELYVLGPEPPLAADQFGPEQPDDGPLPYASPTDPTEASTPACANGSVKAIEVYYRRLCALGRESNTRHPL